MAIGTLHLSILGMTCDNCTHTVERTLASTPGVTKVEVSLPASSATVEYDVDLVKPEVLVNAVRELGYDVPA
jgi:Cu+-exporting ATPase